MAAPRKIGLQYYNTDTDRYQDIKIKRLKHSCGAVGIAVHDYILCEIYRVKGCFTEWDESRAFDVSEYFGLKETTVQEIVACCCAVGLFNKDLFTSGRILTSRSIQFRYAKICQDAKRSNWFIPKEIDLTTELTPLLPEETPVNSVSNAQSKVKDSKEKKNNTGASPEFIFRLYGQLISERLSAYFPKHFASFLKQWQGKNDRGPDYPTTKIVLDKMDEIYHSHEFSNANHVRKAFEYVYENKIKGQAQPVKKRTLI